MNIASILILSTLLGGPAVGQPLALAHEDGVSQEAERVEDAREKKQAQDADRTKKAREQKQGQDADRTKKAREQKQGQDADRTKKAREQKKGQNADRTKKARDQDQDKEAERMKALRLERRANRPERVIGGSRIQTQSAPQARAADVNKGARGDAQRSDQARLARADKQREQVSEFTQLVREHRVRLAKISRLEGVYAGQGDKAKANRVRALHQRELKNFERIVARSRKQLGNEHYKSVAKRLKLDD